MPFCPALRCKTNPRHKRANDRNGYLLTALLFRIIPRAPHPHPCQIAAWLSVRDCFIMKILQVSGLNSRVSCGGITGVSRCQSDLIRDCPARILSCCESDVKEETALLLSPAPGSSFGFARFLGMIQKVIHSGNVSGDPKDHRAVEKPRHALKTNHVFRFWSIESRFAGGRRPQVKRHLTPRYQEEELANAGIPHDRFLRVGNGSIIRPFYLRFFPTGRKSLSITLAYGTVNAKLLDGGWCGSGIAHHSGWRNATRRAADMPNKCATLARERWRPFALRGFPTRGLEGRGFTGCGKTLPSGHPEH